MKRKLIALFAIAIAGSLVAGRVITAADKAAPVAPGNAAPLFALKDQAGKEFNLADYKDKTVVVEWFNHDCPFVIRHHNLGTMQRLSAEYSAKGVVWVAVNSSHYGTAENDSKFAAQYKLTYPILRDPTGEVGRRYAATRTPEIVIVHKGNVVYRGAIDSQKEGKADVAVKADTVNYVAKALDELLAGKPVSQSETTPYGCTVKYKE